jgi:hypothetical protein
MCAKLDYGPRKRPAFLWPGMAGMPAMQEQLQAMAMDGIHHPHPNPLLYAL